MSIKINERLIIDVLKSYTSVQLKDFSEFIPEKSANGGHYGYFLDISRDKDGVWHPYFGTTSDFEMCPHCGWFTSDCQCVPINLTSEEEVVNYIKKLDRDYEIVSFD